MIDFLMLLGIPETVPEPNFVRIVLESLKAKHRLM